MTIPIRLLNVFNGLKKPGILLVLLAYSPNSLNADSPDELRAAIVSNADEFLEKLEISYVYGGSKVGPRDLCEDCNRCLETKLPKGKERLKVCPVCSECSIDCSHFVQLVYSAAGIRLPYLPTAIMLDSDKLSLSRKYGLIDVGAEPERADIGDLLVYRGHVVVLVERPKSGRGRIVHATGGKDIRLPGQGIQTERSALLANFRGPLLRILRPKALTSLPAKAQSPDKAP